MTNTNSPRGFGPSSLISGAVPNFGLTTVPMAYNASAVYKGDPLKLVSGKVAVATVTGNTGAAVIGIADSFSWVSIAQARRVWQSFYPGNDSQGNADVTVWMVNQPDALFDVQINAGGPAVQADVGSFFNWATGTGNTYSGLSGFSLDYSTKNATQGSLPFVLYSLNQAPGTDPTSNYNIVRVGFATQTTL
jgi:hypothetical protein